MPPSSKKSSSSATTQNYTQDPFVVPISSDLHSTNQNIQHHQSYSHYPTQQHSYLYSYPTQHPHYLSNLIASPIMAAPYSPQKSINMPTTKGQGGVAPSTREDILLSEGTESIQGQEQRMVGAFPSSALPSVRRQSPRKTNNPYKHPHEHYPQQNTHYSVQQTQRLAGQLPPPSSQRQQGETSFLHRQSALSLLPTSSEADFLNRSPLRQHNNANDASGNAVAQKMTTKKQRSTPGSAGRRFRRDEKDTFSSVQSTTVHSQSFIMRILYSPYLFPLVLVIAVCKFVLLTVWQLTWPLLRWIVKAVRRALKESTTTTGIMTPARKRLIKRSSILRWIVGLMSTVILGMAAYFGIRVYVWLRRFFPVKEYHTVPIKSNLHHEASSDSASSLWVADLTKEIKKLGQEVSKSTAYSKSLEQSMSKQLTDTNTRLGHFQTDLVQKQSTLEHDLKDLRRDLSELQVAREKDKREIREELTNLAMMSSRQSEVSTISTAILQSDLTFHHHPPRAEVFSSIALPDYALLSLGARPIEWMCSETWPSRHWFKGLFDWVTSYNPRETRPPFFTLYPDLTPGMCWCFVGNKGKLTIQLPFPVFIEAFSLGHALNNQLPASHRGSVPKNFQLYALEGRTEHGAKLLVTGTYSADNDMNPYQTFQLTSPLARPSKYIQLRIESNWGDPEITCLYHVRIHGRSQLKERAKHDIDKTISGGDRISNSLKEEQR